MDTKPRLQHERRASTRSIATALTDGSADTRAIKTEIIKLIKEERAVQEWADTNASKGTNEQYRSNMTVAKANSREVENALLVALRCLKTGDQAQASASLLSVAGTGSKATKPSNGAYKLYQDYLTETDQDFHSWLTRNGHEDILVALGVSTVKTKRTKRTFDSSKNRPEDYE